MKKSGDSEAIKRKLIFIRHGKAEDQIPEIPDFERSLTAKGKHHSRLMAQIMKSREKEPGRVRTSPAFRAIETALIFCREYDVSPGKIEICPDLYFNLEPGDFKSFIGSQDDKSHTITLFGHNPLMTEMASFFAANEPDELPKTGILCLSFKVGSWSEIEPESGVTEYFLKPKSLL